MLPLPNFLVITMKIEDVKQIISNRLSYLRSQRVQAVAVGDLEQVAILDVQILETQLTLDQLLTL
jgi:hypothetical protein